MDYCFLRDYAGGDYIVVIAGRDRRTGVLFSHVVPNKGGSVDWLVPQLIRDLCKLGYYNTVTLKTDQEPAIVDLMKDVARARGDVRTVIEPGKRPRRARSAACGGTRPCSQACVGGEVGREGAS